MSIEEETVDRFNCLLGFEQDDFVRACAKLIQAAEDMIEAEPLTVKEMKARKDLIAALEQCKKSDACPL